MQAWRQYEEALKHALLLCLLLAALVLAAACTRLGLTPTPTPTATPTPIEVDFGNVVAQKESRLSPAQGAVVVLPDGAALSVPANTVDSNATVRLMRSQAPAGLKGAKSLGDVYYVGSVDRPRAQGEFTLSIPYDRSKLPSGVAEGDLQAYGLVDGDILFPVASKVDRARQMVVVRKPEVTVLNGRPGFGGEA